MVDEMTFSIFFSPEDDPSGIVAQYLDVMGQMTISSTGRLLSYVPPSGGNGTWGTRTALYANRTILGGLDGGDFFTISNYDINAPSDHVGLIEDGSGTQQKVGTWTATNPEVP